MLLLTHFRETFESGAFYSLPSQYLDAVPLAEAAEALGPAVKPSEVG